MLRTRAIGVAVDTPALLGESPFWHPTEQCLYYCDIAGRQLCRFDPVTQQLSQWQFAAEVASCAPFSDGSVLLAMRDGLWKFEPHANAPLCPTRSQKPASAPVRTLLAPPPYEPQTQRFNDGKCDAQGRFWVGTLDDARKPLAALYCYTPAAGLQQIAAGATVVNGLAWSPDGQTLYWSDTPRHTIYASPALGGPYTFASFSSQKNLATYIGRPDGAAVDVQGNYWVAMFEGQRLLCLSPQGAVLQDIALPVCCPTMPCFGGPQRTTLYLTTARHGRSSDELVAQPLAGCVLQLEVDVPGLPVNFCAPQA
jgi:sugar lactone lactonase YvrE